VTTASCGSQKIGSQDSLGNGDVEGAFGAFTLLALFAVLVPAAEGTVGIVADNTVHAHRHDLKD